MKTRWKITLTVLLVVSAAGLVSQLMWIEPGYKGRPISVWLDDWAARRAMEDPQMGDPRTAVREVGTAGLPYAVRNLARNDSQWRKKYGELQRKLPKFLQKVFHAPKPSLQVVDGANIFHYIGSNSIPHAIALLKHDSPSVRQAAAWGLSSLRKQSTAANQAIPALIEALNDTDQMARFYAVLALRDMGADASNAVPALTKVLAVQTNLTYLRAAVALALGKIGFSAASALPYLKAALQQPDSYLRGQVAVAIWRIDSDVDTALPVLLQEMAGTISSSAKWDWIVALGEMGPRAELAVPLLTNELKKGSSEWVLKHVTNALMKIDPEAAIPAGANVGK